MSGKIILLVACFVFLSLITLGPDITSASSETRLYVDPLMVETYVSATFTVDVKIANVELLYGFDYKLGWNSTILDLLKIELFPPWEPWFLPKNETGVNPETGLNYWWISLGPLHAPPFTGNTTLARLTFKAKGSGSSILDLHDTELVDDLGNPIPHDVYDGYAEVEVRLVGDVNYDGIVDILDVVLAAVAFGSKPGDPNWNLYADLNADDFVDIFDMVIIGINYGKTG